MGKDKEKDDARTISGTTPSGFVFTIDEKAIGSYRLLQALRMIDKGKTGFIIDAVEQLLGEEQEEGLIRFAEDNLGGASTENIVKVFMEVLEAAGELKNS